jgi:hypothetical protein
VCSDLELSLAIGRKQPLLIDIQCYNKDYSVLVIRFVNYGSGPKRFPIQDVLQYALEFAQGTDVNVPVMNSLDAASSHMLRPPLSADIDMESPMSHSRLVFYFSVI